MDIIQTSGTKFSGTGRQASGSATIVRAASGSRVHYITDISAAVGVGTGHLRLYSDTDNTLFESVIDSSGYRKEFVVPIQSAAGTVVTLRLDNFSGSAYVNLGGYFIG